MARWTQTTWALTGLVVALLGACGDPPPPCVDGAQSTLMGCSRSWRCLDGEQLVDCRASEAGGADCSCFVDGLPQRDGDAQAGRGFHSELEPAAFCADPSIVERVNAGCRWHVSSQ